MTGRYLPLAERDAAAHTLLVYLAARHPGTPVAGALAEIAADPCQGPVIHALAEESLAVARRSQADLARVLFGGTP